MTSLFSMTSALHAWGLLLLGAAAFMLLTIAVKKYRKVCEL